MLIFYLIGIVTWWVGNCNGESLEATVADNVAEILIDHLINHLTPARIERLAQLLAQHDEKLKSKAIANSLNEFTPKAYRTILRDDYEDIIFSPFTTYMSLSMLASGSKDPTKEQLHALLEQWFNDPLDAQTKFSTLIDQLNSLNPNEFDLRYKIFYPDVCTSTAYLKSIEKIFRSKSQGLNFKTSLIKAKETINNWFTNATRENPRSGFTTRDVINDLNEDTNLVVCNAVYFKRKFERALAVDTVRWFPDHEQLTAAHERQFYVADGNYSHGEMPEIHAKFIELPYQNTGENINMSMFVVVPTHYGSFAELDTYIDKVTMEKLLQRSYGRIKASFPALTFSTLREFSLPLEHLGAGGISASDADFTKFFDCPGQHVTKFIQKNVVVMQTDGALGLGENLPPWGSNPTDIEFNVQTSFIVIIAVTSPTPSILLIGRRQS